MKNLFLLVLILGTLIRPSTGQVSISVDNSVPNPSAMLEVKSGSKGFLPPRLTTQQRNGISTPAEGLVIYNTDLQCLEFYTGTVSGWQCPCPCHLQPDCGSVIVSGSYFTGQPLDQTHTIQIPVNVLVPGGYQIYTNMLNGIYFASTGIFTSTGAQTLVLRGEGTPEYEGSFEFYFAGWNETCYFSVSVQSAPVPGLFRSGIFLHHSTGGNIWGPNGSSTSIPQEMVAYNTQHGHTGDQAVTMMEEWWSPGDNEWVTQHEFFENPDPVSGIGYYLPGNPVIVIKSCFPSSSMTGWGTPADTLNPWEKSVYNYKWHWRHIVQAMSALPGNFFAIWTNAPLEPWSTNADEAFYSRQFCRWAKDTLAAGLDPEFGEFPANVYVFDFFSKLTGPNGMMLSMYAASPGDSHPNSAATALVAPQFVSEIFDAAIVYESVLAPSNPCARGKKE